MTRRKCVCSKWTLVLLVVLVCPYVQSRPQETNSSVKTEISTENVPRYYSNLRLSSVPKVISVETTGSTNVNKTVNNITSSRNRTSKYVRSGNKNKSRNDNKINSPKSTVTKVRIPQRTTNSDKRKPPIRKVLTKWKDEAKIEDFNFHHESNSENEMSNESTSTENVKDVEEKQHYYNHYGYMPQHPQYSEESQVYSSNIQIVDTHPYTQQIHTPVIHTPHIHTPVMQAPHIQTPVIHLPQIYTPQVHTYTTRRPSPTPIITNVGYPPPWHQNSHIFTKPTTKKPVRVTKPLNYNYHNSVNNYAGEFEVTTFQPSSAYTEKIVIRPEEYSASPDECPTIFLTLNNTFQGQGKEACPDLNIAVNTNVINKNNVVESEEDDVEGFFSNGFGIPLEDSAVDDSAGEGEGESEQVESASVEETELSNYNAANDFEESEEPESVASSSSSSHLSALSKPHKPHKDKNKDFFTSLISYFRPAMSALAWLVSINPFAIGLFPLFLTPLAFLFAGSGFASLFSPWFLPIGREAPTKVVHVYRPYWHWDDKIKTWHLHSYPDNRKESVSMVRKEVVPLKDDVVKPTLFYRLKEWMKSMTDRINSRSIGRLMSKETDRKSKRKKRETWTIRVNVTSQEKIEEKKTSFVSLSSSPGVTETPRDVKTKVPIRDSIKLVANQLLDKPNETETPVLEAKVATKLKTQPKHKVKTRNDDTGHDHVENAHAGIAVPVTLEELELEKGSEHESTTSNEGISTWVLVSNPSNNNSSASTEPTKIDDTKPVTNKPKPITNKNKTKKPPTKTPPKRPVIGSTNKADLIAGGSAINENVLNKIKDTVLSNVQKNKQTTTMKTTTAKPTTIPLTTETTTTVQKEETKAPIKINVTTKPLTKPKKKNKNKPKISTTVEPLLDDSALLPTEAKEQEIELEVSTPPVTTKKPKRNATRKKTKTKKRKPSKSKPEETAVLDIKTTTNKTKAAKPAKKPASPAVTTQLYNYFSREVMPSVGVGVLGLASIVGIASYFFYPFSTPVRRTFEVDKRDDLYKNNAEEYANEGNGQAEEEMLGTVLAGMPAHAKNKLNPYAGQTAYINRYPAKKEQDIRYRHVATKYEPNYNVRYPQQKTGIAHGAVYNSKPVNYSPHYETRHVYTTEGKFNFDKLPTSYVNYPTVEPIYAAPQTGPSSSGISSFGSDSSNSVVYGVKPSAESDFKPVYPFEGFYSESTSSPVTYAPTSLYLGSNNEGQQTEEKYETSSISSEEDESKFVVGNVPKELSDSDSPAVVPEHGPRKMSRRKRNAANKRSISTSVEELLTKEKESSNYLSNDVVETYPKPMKMLSDTQEVESIAEKIPLVTKNQYEPAADEMTMDMQVLEETINEVVESISTLPITDENNEKLTTEPDTANDAEPTTSSFKVYEVYPSDNPSESPVFNGVDSTTAKNMMTETTTEIRVETTSNMPSTSPPYLAKDPLPSTVKPTPITPDVITYPPPPDSSSLFSFFKRLLDFKVRLGLSILKSTSEQLSRYLKSLETSTQKSHNE